MYFWSKYHSAELNWLLRKIIMTKYKIYKLKYSIVDNKNKYVEIKEIEINDNNIETQELLEEESGKKYYRISMTSGKTYIIGK